jgi:ribosome-associated toxin RatA of RatAB toxin-antitoxin module
MTEIKKSITLPYTSKQVYDLVSDLVHYPEFLSWCKGVTVHSKTPYKTNVSINASKYGMDFTFSVLYQFEPTIIKIYLLNKGPFKSIDAIWRFQALTDNETLLSFEMNYELSGLIGWTLTPILKIEVNALLKDFSERAKKLFGTLK